MAWVYLDDHFDEHHKVLAAGDIHPLAPWLFVCGLTYCRRACTAGLIPESKVRTLTPLYRKGARDALVKVGLWDAAGRIGGIAVHDYAEWNRTSEAKSASARNAAMARWNGKKHAQRNA